MESRRIYPSLDIMKFVMAMLILTQHISNEWAHCTGLAHAFFGLGNFAVPFFFACSGFLFFSKLNKLEPEEQKTYYRKWSVRLGKMYLVWSLIYFSFVFYGWAVNGFPQEKILTYFHRALVFSTYATIWFLPALWVGVSVCYWLRRHCSRTVFWILILLLLVMGSSFGSYNEWICGWGEGIKSFHETYMQIFVTWRNGLFNGTPFVALGLIFTRNHPPKLTLPSLWKPFLGIVICGGGFLAEAFLITHFKWGNATDQGFMMFPSIYFLMYILLACPVKEHTLWLHCRNLSMLIFLGQRLFLTAIPGILPQVWSESIKSLPTYIIFLLFVTIVLAFSVFIERMSEKHKVLKILW